MQRKRIFLKAASTIEYTTLIVIIMIAILFAQKYIVRGFAGRWKDVGDSFGQGRQYDPRRTADCAWTGPPQNRWYNPGCFESYWEQNFPNLARACFLDCRLDGGMGPCGGAASCPCYIPHPFGGGCLVYDRNCCYNQCQSECRDYATTTGTNQCLTDKGIPCN